MFLIEYKKTNGQTIVLLEGYRLTIEETSNCVYQIDLFDNRMRSVSNHGTNLNNIVEKAIEDLIKMRN